MACIDRYFLASTPNRVTHPNTGKFKDTIALAPVIPAIFRPESMLGQAVKRSTFPRSHRSRVGMHTKTSHTFNSELIIFFKF